MYFPTTFCLVFLGFCLQSTIFAAKFNCSTAAFEKCVDRMLMMGDETFTYPTNLKEMNKRCRDIKPLNICTQDYVQNCLKGEAKNSVKLILYGVAKSNRAYCSSSNRKKQHISFGKCANANKKAIIAQTQKCNRQWHGILQYPDPKLRLPLLCCTYFTFTKGIAEALRSCREPEAVAYEQMIESYAADGLNLLCGSYGENSDICEPLLPRIPKWDKPLNTKVFFLTAIDILSSL